MKKEIKEVTWEELLHLIEIQEGEIFIHVELGEEEGHGEKGTISA